MATAWIEPKKGTPCWVKWREPAAPGEKKGKRGRSPVFYSRGEAERWRTDKNQELDRAATVQRAFKGTHLLPIPTLLTQRAAAKKRAHKNGDFFIAEFDRTIKAMCAEMGWTSTRSITTASVLEWLDVRNGVGIQKPMAILKSFLRWVRRPPCRQPIHADVLDLEVEVKRGQRHPMRLDTAEVQAVLAAGYSFGLAQGMVLEHLSRFGPRVSTVGRMVVGDWKSCTSTPRITADGQVIGGWLRLAGIKNKNGNDVVHPVDLEFAKKLDVLCLGRSAADPLYVNLAGKAWKQNKNGGGGQLTDWYVANVSSKLLKHDRWGINCLKDYAISVMDENGIDDATKQTFTGHRDPTSYRHYKTTNAETQARALAKIPRAPTPTIGGSIGGKPTKRGRSGGKVHTTTPHQITKTPMKSAIS